MVMKHVTRISKEKIRKSGLYKKKELISPLLNIELTERCNNNCAHCYINLPADDFNAKNNELTTGGFKAILREAVSLEFTHVRFTGGEPLLRDDFEELYIFSRKLGLRALISTNATLITPRMAELFKRIPPLEKIGITVYGMKKESYEKTTGSPGSYEAFKRGVSLLLKQNIPFMVAGVILPHTKKEMDEFESWAATIPWMDIQPSYNMIFDLRCDREPKKNEAIKKLRVSPEDQVKILTRRNGYVKSAKQYFSAFMPYCSDKLFCCDSELSGGSVTPYGYFRPCPAIGRPDLVYDLKKGSLKDAMLSIFPKIKKIKAVNPDYLMRCARCFLSGFCDQCPAKSWMEHGTLDTPVEYLCESAHASARFLGLVRENEKAWEIKDGRKRIEEFLAK